MLQKISDRIQGWVAGVIIAIITAVFALWGVEYYISRGSADSKPIATVNGKEVTTKSLKLLTQQLQARVQAKQPNKPITPQQRDQIKLLALQQLTSSMALFLAAEKQGFNVSKQVVQQIILQAPEFQMQGMFSPQRFQQFLLNTQLSETEFLNEMRRRFLINQVVVGIGVSAFILPNELKLAYQLIYQKRNFGYFILPLSKYLKNVTVNDQAIQQYYQQNKAAYKTPEMVQMNYLLLSPSVIEKTIQLPLADLKAYYQSNKATFTTPKQWKVLRITLPIKQTTTPKQASVATAQQRLQKIRLRVQRGESLQHLAKTSGLTTSTHVYTLATAPTALADVLVTLQPGQVSHPFRTNHDVNLIKLISMTPRKVKSFAEVKDEIQKHLMRERAQEIFSKKSDVLSNLTYTNPDTLDIAAKKLGLAVQTSNLFSKAGLKKGIFSHHAVIVTAFSNDVLQNKNNSHPIELSDGSIVVIRVNRHLPSHVQSLKQVKENIQKVLKKNQAESKAGLVAYQISNALSKGQSPQALAKQHELEWVSKLNVQRNSQSTPRPILEAAFLTPPANSKTGLGVDTLVLPNGDYVVLKVASVSLGDVSKDSSDQLQKLQVELARLSGDLDYRLYKKSVIKHSKITILSHQ